MAYLSRRIVVHQCGDARMLTVARGGHEHFVGDVCGHGQCARVRRTQLRRGAM